MISDDELYRLALFLGLVAMLMIILYHFLEVNTVEKPTAETKPSAASMSQIDSKISSAMR
jgi:oligosaccharyl transferase complex subunit OST4